MTVYKFLILLAFLVLLSLVINACTSDVKHTETPDELLKKYPGKWSVSSKEDCFLLIVRECKRIDSYPDSIDFYLDEIELLTKDYQAGNCLYLDHQIITHYGKIEEEHSRIYIIRNN